jgi:hypothetical protein
MHEHTVSSRHAIREFPCSVQFCRHLKIRTSIICIFNQTVLNTRVIKSLDFKRVGLAARTGEVRNTATVLIWQWAINVSRDRWQCSARRPSNLPWVLVKNFEFYLILLNNQRDAALSSRIYSSLWDYCTCFGLLSAPIIRSTIKTADAIIGTVQALNYKSIV